MTFSRQFDLKMSNQGSNKRLCCIKFFVQPYIACTGNTVFKLYFSNIGTQTLDVLYHEDINFLHKTDTML